MRGTIRWGGPTLALAIVTGTIGIVGFTIYRLDGPPSPSIASKLDADTLRLPSQIHANIPPSAGDAELLSAAPNGNEVPVARPLIPYSVGAHPVLYQEPTRVREYIQALGALRAANVAEADAERIAAKLTRSEANIAVATFIDDRQATFWAVRRPRKPPTPLAPVSREHDPFARVPM